MISSRHSPVLFLKAAQKPFALGGLVVTLAGMLQGLLAMSGPATGPITHPITGFCLVIIATKLILADRRGKAPPPVRVFAWAALGLCLLEAITHLTTPALSPSLAFNRLVYPTMPTHGRTGFDSAILTGLMLGSLLLRRRFSKLLMVSSVIAIWLFSLSLFGKLEAHHLFGADISPLTLVALILFQASIIAMFSHKPPLQVLFLRTPTATNVRRLTIGISGSALIAGIFVYITGDGSGARGTMHAPTFMALSATVLLTFIQTLLLGGAAQGRADRQAAIQKTLQYERDHDALTRTLSRRAGYDLLSDSFASFTTSGRNTMIVIADLDNFKSVNDTYGHETGDAVLTAAGDAFRACLRKGDRVVRWGGEEFLLIMHDCPADEADALCNRLRVRFNTLLRRTCPDLAAVQLSASFGVSYFQIGDLDEDAAIGRADAALYNAKDAGRDRVHMRLAKA